MLGSVIPKRWIVSFALVGLVAVTVSSFSTAWAAGGLTLPTSPTVPDAEMLFDGRVSPQDATIPSSGTLEVEAIPIGADAVEDPDMAFVSYAWTTTCGALSSSTTREVVFTPSGCGASATLTVVMSQTEAETGVTGTLSKSTTVTITAALEASVILDCGRVAPQGATISSGGTLTLQAIPKGLDGLDHPGMAGVSYLWTRTGGTLSTDTGSTVVFTPSSGSTSGTVTVVMSQVGAVDVEDSSTITVRPPAATAVPTAVPVNPPESTPVLPTPVSEDTEQAVVTPAEGGTLETEDGNVVVEVPAGAASAYMGVQVVPVEPTGEDVPPPPLAFSVGSRVVSIVFTDDAGNALTNVVLDRPVRVCVAYTDADAAAAEGGVFGLELLRYADPPGEWVALNTTVDPLNKRLCGYTTRFSLFAVGLSKAPAVEGVILPATGDYAPSAGLVMGLIGVGVVFVGFGLLTLRRRRMNT